MPDYLIKKCNVGYVIFEHWGENRGLASQIWAFSPLAEAQAYLPNLFEKDTNSLS